MIDKVWIGVDFDRTLAVYTHWVRHDELGAPIWSMVEFVKQLLKDGHTVKIFTARISNLANETELKECIEAIQSWCKLYLGQVLEVTNQKDQHCIAIYDDIARQVVANTGRIVYDTPSAS